VPTKKFDDYSLIWIQYTNVSDRRTDGRTDRQTPFDSKDRAYASYSIAR